MTVDLAIELLLSLIARSQEVSALIMKARGEGREVFTPEEWDEITAASDAARQALVEAIQKAEGGGL